MRGQAPLTPRFLVKEIKRVPINVLAQVRPDEASRRLPAKQGGGRLMN